MRAARALCAALLVAGACGSNDDGANEEFVSRSGGSVLAPEEPQDSARSSPASTPADTSPSRSTTRGQELGGSGECGVSAATQSVSKPTLINADVGIDDALIGMRGHAVAAGDVNGDGRVDLFVGGFADRDVESYQHRGATGPAPDRLLLATDAGFVLDTDFPEMFGRTSGAAFADLDADGDLDLVVARNPRDKERGDAPSELLVNTDGRFARAVTLDDQRGLRSVGVLDYDNNGTLDLFLVEDRFSGGSSVLLRNDGRLGFSDVTQDAGLPNDLFGLGVAAVDLDSSGTVDLFVAGANRMFLNRGATFEEVAGPFDWPVYGDEDDMAGVAAADVDGNGTIDLLVGQHYNSTVDAGREVSVRLYLNRGGASFEDATEAAGLVGLPTKAPHVEFVDIDADGRLDIITTASADSGTLPAVYRNVSTGADVNFASPENVGDPQYWVAGATLDVDGDASPETFLVEWEPALGARLVRWPTGGNRHVSVEFARPGGGVGAEIRFSEPNGAGRVLATMPVVASTGYGSGAVSGAALGAGDLGALHVAVVETDGSTVDLGVVDGGTRIIVGPGGAVRCGP